MNNSTCKNWSRSTYQVEKRYIHNLNQEKMFALKQATYIKNGCTGCWREQLFKELNISVFLSVLVACNKKEAEPIDVNGDGAIDSSETFVYGATHYVCRIIPVSR